MKILWAVVFSFYLTTGFWMLAVTPKPTPKPSATPIVKQDMVCRTKQQDLELRDWIKGIMTAADAAKSENNAGKMSNLLLQSQLDQAKADATKLAQECAADHACAQKPLSCWFHRLLKHIFWVIGILVVVGILLMIFAPGVASAIGAFFVFIFKWILKLFSPKT